MKKSLLVVAMLGMVAGLSHAQSSVTVYGALDIGLVNVKTNLSTTSLGRGDNNKLGFKGVEDLGGGLAALFQLEMRLEPDTGSTEAAPNRPLFQGESRVGLKGDFGMVRLGRGLSSMQETVTAFEVWHYASNRANLQSFLLAAYNGDPLNPGSSQNRMSNAVFYNSPAVENGFQFNGSIATKESLGAGTPKISPYSLSGTYKLGGFAVMLGYEKNAIETKFSNVAGTFTLDDLKFYASYAEQKIALTQLGVKGYTMGATYTIGAGMLMAGYGRNKPDNIDKTDQISLGYEHRISKRTFLYTDVLNRKAPGVSDVRLFDLGIHHNF